MTRWQELLDIMMLGTQNAPGTVETTGDQTPEQALLRQIALAGAYRRAGVVAKAVKKPDADAAPPETLPVCSPGAVGWLHRISDKFHTRELALDWFLLMRQRGKRVPHTALPHLLGLAAQHDAWAPYIVPLLGERGRWIVEQSDGYKKLKQPELWEAGAGADLKPAEIDPKNQILLDLRTEMMEGLAHE